MISSWAAPRAWRSPLGSFFKNPIRAATHLSLRKPTPPAWAASLVAEHTQVVIPALLSRKAPAGWGWRSVGWTIRRDWEAFETKHLSVLVRGSYCKSYIFPRLAKAQQPYQLWTFGVNSLIVRYKLEGCVRL